MLKWALDSSKQRTGGRYSSTTLAITGAKTLMEGQEVEFDVTQVLKGLRATKVKIRE